MAITYSTTVAGDRLQQVLDRLQTKTPAAATGSATAGALVIGTSSLSGATGVLVTIPLNIPPGTISGKVLTLNVSGMTANPAAGGTAALAELRNNAGTVIASGLSVGTSGTDIIIGSTTIQTGVPVTISAGTITHP